MSFDRAQKYLDMLLADIRPVEEAYQDESFSYFAVKSNDAFVLVQGTLYLNIGAPAVPLGQFESANVKCGHFKLADVGIGRTEFIERIKSGHIPIPGGELAFPGSDGMGGYGANYFPFHEIGLPQRRVSVLWIFGAQSSELVAANQPGLDWEVRASPTPYDGTQELLAEFQPGILRGVNRIDVAALEVAAIDGSSVVEGELATLRVRAAGKTITDKISVGMRVTNQGKVVERREVLGNNFTWTIDEKGMRVGEFKFAVARAAVVQAFAKYNGVVQHLYFFGDPNSFQNPRRASYEAFDPRLEIFNEILAKTLGARPEARDFEAAMPWIFWQIGFAPVFLGGAAKMRDAPDFLVSTPNGHIAVVECTVGLLKDDSKLQRLHDRAEAVRRNLDTSSTRHVRVLPVIITAKSAEAIKADMEQAEKLGIFVIAREGIEQLIPATLFPQNADQFFERAEQSVREAQAKHAI
jgi:hypothetical protein